MIANTISHGLGPTRHWVLKQAGFDFSGEQLWAPLTSAVNDAGINLALLNRVQTHIEKALSEADIPGIWLKGIALAYTIYPRPWLRPMADLDVLVPAHQKDEALSKIEGIGFHEPPPEPINMYHQIP